MTIKSRGVVVATGMALSAAMLGACGSSGSHTSLRHPGVVVARTAGSTLAPLQSPGVQNSTGPTSGPPTAAPSTGRPSTTAAPATGAPPTVPPNPRTVVGPATCGPSQLGVAAAASQGAVGHGGQIIVLTNTSSQTCLLNGYPGIGLVSASGQVQSITVPRAKDSGFLFRAVAPSAVTLPKGGQASFWMEWINVTGPQDGTLEVTPPNDVGHLDLANTSIPIGVTSITVSPLRLGVIPSPQGN